MKSIILVQQRPHREEECIRQKTALEEGTKQLETLQAELDEAKKAVEILKEENRKLEQKLDSEKKVPLLL